MATNNNTPDPAINAQDPNATFGGAVITGFGQPGSTVSLDVNGTTSGTSAPVAADGTWEFLTGLPNGTDNITSTT